jgi:hypothetical protein
LNSVFAEGTVDTASDDIAIDALSRLDNGVGASNRARLLADTGDVVDDGSLVLRVTRKDSKVTLLAFKSWTSADHTASMGLVNVEDADGSVHTFAERDLSTGDGVATKVVSTLYTIDSDGVTKVSNTVLNTQASVADDSQTSAQALHALNNDSFGSPKMCTICTAVQTAIITARPFLTMLVTHHFFTAACPAIGFGAGLAAAETGLGAILAGEAGYKGCLLVMAGAAALVVASYLLPKDLPGKQHLCNQIAGWIPGQGGPWCVDHGPASCAISTVNAPTDPVNQCMAVGRCARDSKCPADTSTFCGGLFLGTSDWAVKARAQCASVDAFACSGNVQGEADLHSGCVSLNQ